MIIIICNKTNNKFRYDEIILVELHIIIITYIMFNYYYIYNVLLVRYVGDYLN